MATRFEIDDGFVAEQNSKARTWLEEDYDHLARVLRRKNVDIEELVVRSQSFRVAVPSWGVGTGGTRFARFAGPGEPRDIYEKLEDCGAIFKLARSTPAVSLHIPWDKPNDPAGLREFARARGLHFDAMNSNTFQDQAGQKLSYKFGSLTHPDAAVRRQAIDHNLECIEIGKVLGSKAHTVWIGDGGNFPGQMHFRRALERYLESAREIYDALPDDWRVFLEHKLYEPAFYSTVINDWGTSYYASELGPKAFCLVDLGHHAPKMATLQRIIERGGEVRAMVVPDRRRATLQAAVKNHVEAGSALYSDALLSYNGLEGDYAHQVINHAVKYVEGNVHTNGMENFWSLLKRCLNGTYVSVEPFHLFRYLDEETFRFNMRKMNDAERFVLALQSIIGKRLTYKAVTGKNEPVATTTV